MLAPPVSCSALKQRLPAKLSGKYQIDPKATYNTSVEVNCDMNDKNGVGVTEIGHDSESSIKVLLDSVVSNIKFSQIKIGCKNIRAY